MGKFYLFRFSARIDLSVPHYTKMYLQIFIIYNSIPPLPRSLHSATLIGT